MMSLPERSLQMRVEPLVCSLVWKELLFGISDISVILDNIMRAFIL